MTVFFRTANPTARRWQVEMSFPRCRLLLLVLGCDAQERSSRTTTPPQPAKLLSPSQGIGKWNANCCSCISTSKRRFYGKRKEKFKIFLTSNEGSQFWPRKKQVVTLQNVDIANFFFLFFSSLLKELRRLTMRRYVAREKRKPLSRFQQVQNRIGAQRSGARN